MRRSDWLMPPLALKKLRQHHASDTPSVKRWRWRARARAHTRHTPDVCALRSLEHGYVQEVKNDINTVRFLTQTASFRVLGHQGVVYDGNCLILISLCMCLFPSYRDKWPIPAIIWLTERFDLKNIKIGSTEEKKTPTSWMPLGVSWIDTKF